MTNKLDGINRGDRVRVTFEGVFSKIAENGGFNIAPDGGTYETFFDGSEVLSNGFHIEKLAEPLKVGDRVFDSLAGSCATIIGEVFRDDQRHLWLDGGPSGFRTRHESAVKQA